MNEKKSSQTTRHPFYSSLEIRRTSSYSKSCRYEGPWDTVEAALVVMAAITGPQAQFRLRAVFVDLSSHAEHRIISGCREKRFIRVMLRLNQKSCPGSSGPGDSRFTSISI